MATAYIGLLVLLIAIIFTKNFLEKSWPSQLLADAIGLPFLSVLIHHMFAEKVISVLNFFFVPDISGFVASAPVSIALAILLLSVLNYTIKLIARLTTYQSSPEKLIGKEDFNDYCDILKRHIKKINRSTNWSDNVLIELAELDAEIETRYKGKYKRKTVGLLNALKKSKNHKDKTFLVLGTPGSGKSVAMRKLCLDMFDDISKHNKIPLYINLKEWGLEHNATSPKKENVEQFIRHYLVKDVLNYEKRLLLKHFDSLLRGGAFFFVFDSYDELPALISGKKQQIRNKKISEAIYDFVLSTKSQCVLASRPFRSPTSEFEANTIFEVNPLDDSKIIPYLKKNIGLSTTEIKDLFKNNYNVWRYLRNPLIATLISDYYKKNQCWPENQSVAYADFIRGKIKKQLSQNSEGIKLTVENICDVATMLASIMISSNKSKAELSLNHIEKKLNVSWDVKKAVQILEGSFICRYTDESRNHIAFSHNRFQEYFFIQSIIHDDKLNPEYYSDIPNCGSYFDILVLYCEIANESSIATVKEIINFCTEVIKTNSTNYNDINKPKCLRAINCLSFLSLSFSRNTELLNEVIDDIKEIVCESIEGCNDLICLSVFAEVNSLLGYDSRIIHKLLVKSRTSVDNILIKHAYNAPIINRNVRLLYFNGLERHSLDKFIRKTNYFIFVFGLSKNTEFLKKYCVLRMVDLLILVSLIVFATYSFAIEGILMIPYITITVYVLIPITFLAFIFLENYISNKKVDKESAILVFYVLPISVLVPTQFEWFMSTSFLFTLFKTRDWLVQKEKFLILLKQRKTFSGLLRLFGWLLFIVYPITILMIVWNILYVPRLLYVHFYALVLMTTLSGLLLIYILLLWLPDKIKIRIYRPNIEEKLLRSEVERTLNKFKTNYIKLSYITMMNEANVSLIGEWENGRPYIDDDDADRILANLDVKSLKLYNNR